MDIDLLSKMVKELILDNDRVVLPGLGSFVAEVVPSTFSDKGYTINPPYRRLYFRSNPSEGSELIEFYAQTNKVSQDVAERIIRDFISDMREILHTRKTVVFPGLGRLRATKENNLFFVADEGLDIYPAGFGLEPISLKTNRETTEEVTATVAGLKSLLDEVPQPEQPQPQCSASAQPQLTQTEPVQFEAEHPEPSQPEPEIIPEHEVSPEPATEPQPQISTVLEPDETELSGETLPVKEHGGNAFLKILVIAACVLVVLTVTYAIIGRICPEWIDQFLYTEEELGILNHRL